jgi:hypothetical protein
MFSDNRIEPHFVDRLPEMQKVAGVNKKRECFSICSTGGRSKMAPQAMVVYGLTRCRSGGGFEGPIDSDCYRGWSNGFNAAGLPWAQS